MKAVIGTAGHIDHGKTALVRALTGIETDRLPEERERGISIELGFAYLDLPDGGRAGIVDVPGHERFIRQMLAGAQGFDLVMLVVAADDGVMPQTEEHFEICHLLGVRRAIVAITKADLVAPARVEEVRSEIEILVVGTEFEDAPVVAISAHEGHGIDELRAVVVETLAAVERSGGTGPFRMPVDRAFVLKGHGIVVTGTGAGGDVVSGDELEVMPRGASVRVREVQVHGEAVERAFAGQRVALNLVGVERGDVARGDCVVAPGLASATERFDAAVEIRPLAGKGVRSHQNVRLYIGTREVLGRIIWLDGVDFVAPRERRYAQLVLQEPTIVFSGDRFVLRDETASRTLGGGIALVTRAHRHRGAEGELAPRLQVLETGSAAERLVVLTDLVTTLGLTPAEAALGVGVDTAEALAAASASDGLVLLPDAASPRFVASATRYARYLDGLVGVVAAFHEQHANLGGIEMERLRTSAGFDVDARLIRSVVDSLVEAGRLVRRGSTVALPGHAVSLPDADEQLAIRLLTAVRESAVMPPTLKQLEESLTVPVRRLSGVVAVLCERRELVKVSPELFYAREVIDDIESRLRGYFADEEAITAAGFRDMISASRKYSIPLLDYFDRSGLTIRNGDYRRLRAAASGRSVGEDNG